MGSPPKSCQAGDLRDGYPKKLLTDVYLRDRSPEDPLGLREGMNRMNSDHPTRCVRVGSHLERLVDVLPPRERWD